MAEIALTQRSEPASRRCPWCLEGEAEGEDWVVCQRDQTPIHGACLDEYGACPICRAPIARLQDQITVRPRVPPLAIERLILPELGDERAAFLHSLRRFYTPAWLAPILGLGALLGLANAAALVGLGAFIALITFIVYLLALVAAGAALSRPRASRWLRLRPSAEARDLARRLVERDLLARQHDRSFHALRRDIARINRAFGDLEEQDRHARLRHERALRELRREEQRRATPIDDARRVRGIGPGVVDALRSAGLASLEDLLAVDPLRIRGIGPRRAQLLTSWARNRERAIERLLAAEPPPEASGDPELARAAEALVDQGRHQLASAEDVLAAIDLWRAEREPNAALLAAVQAR